MSKASSKQIEALKQSIAALETQRGTLGDSVVNASLVPLQEKLEGAGITASGREA